MYMYFWFRSTLRNFAEFEISEFDISRVDCNMKWTVTAAHVYIITDCTNYCLFLYLKDKQLQFDKTWQDDKTIDRPIGTQEWKYTQARKKLYKDLNNYGRFNIILLISTVGLRNTSNIVTCITVSSVTIQQWDLKYRSILIGYSHAQY